MEVSKYTLFSNIYVLLMKDDFMIMPQVSTNIKVYITQITKQINEKSVMYITFPKHV